MTKYCIYDNELAKVRNALMMCEPYLEAEKNQVIKDALKTLDEVETVYAVAAVSKEDVAEKLLGDWDRADEITDDEMTSLVKYMGNAYLENDYWVHIDILGEDIKARITGEVI
jgi:hypothetical protein